MILFPLAETAEGREIDQRLLLRIVAYLLEHPRAVAGEQASVPGGWRSDRILVVKDMGPGGLDVYLADDDD
jgi:hypothetical protein